MSLKKYIKIIYWLQIYFLLSFTFFFLLLFLFIFFPSHFPSNFLGTKHYLCEFFEWKARCNFSILNAITALEKKIRIRNLSISSILVLTKFSFCSQFWQLNTLGLLPTHASDWVSSLPPAQVQFSLLNK